MMHKGIKNPSIRSTDFFYARTSRIFLVQYLDKTGRQDDARHAISECRQLIRLIDETDLAAACEIEVAAERLTGIIPKELLPRKDLPTAAEHGQIVDPPGIVRTDLHEITDPATINL